MQRAAEPGHRLGAPALDTGVLPSAAARRQTALHAATERITWVRAGWEVAAQRGVACTCDESHRSAAAWRRHCRSWRIDHRAYHRRHCGRGIQRPALLSPTARLQGYPEPANVPNLLLPNLHGARWRIVARGPVICWLWLLLLLLRHRFQRSAATIAGDDFKFFYFVVWVVGGGVRVTDGSTGVTLRAARRSLTGRGLPTFSPLRHTAAPALISYEFLTSHFLWFK